MEPPWPPHHPSLKPMISVKVVGRVIDHGLGDKMAVGAVGRGHHVPLAEDGGRRRRDRFLPDAGVSGTMYQIALFQVQHRGLELADQIEQHQHARQVAPGNTRQVVWGHLKGLAASGQRPLNQSRHSTPRVSLAVAD